ncbi:hypothetical protein GCM10025767_06890 [Thalassotalea piscium]
MQDVTLSNEKLLQDFNEKLACDFMNIGFKGFQYYIPIPD